MTVQHPWTNRELRRLKLFYPDMPREKLMEVFAPRSMGAIRMAANGIGVTRESPHRYWLRLAHEYFIRREREIAAYGRPDS